MSTLGVAALAVARRELGVKENPPGSNSGGRIDIYLKNIGLPPAPWCAAFVEWCLEQVGWPRGNWILGYCPSWVAAAQKGVAGMRVIGRDERPEPGDLAMYDWQGDTISDHVGIIESVQGAHTFTALEGNTAVGNDSDGGQVMRRGRGRIDTYCIIRLPAVEVKLPKRLRASGYGVRSAKAIVRRLGMGYQGNVPNLNDRQRYTALRKKGGLGHASAKRVIKAGRKTTTEN